MVVTLLVSPEDSAKTATGKFAGTVQFVLRKQVLITPMFDLRPTRLAQLSGERPATSTRRAKSAAAGGSGFQIRFVMEVIQGTKRSEENSEAARSTESGLRTRWTKAVRTKDE